MGTIICLDIPKLFSELFPNEEVQKHLVRDTKVQWASREKDGYGAEGEKESCVKYGRQMRLE